MSTKVMMEALSPTMEEGRLVKWLKNVGDAVKSGDTLAEVETDKAIMELVARGDGVLRARLVEEGAVCPIGQTIGVIAKADEDISALTGGAAPAAPAATPTPAVAPQSTTGDSNRPLATEAPAAVAAVAAAVSAPAATPIPAAPTGPVRSSPLARRIAAERGVAIEQVHGTGPNGRVIRRDVETAAISAPAPVAASRETVVAAPSTSTKPTAASAPAMVIDRPDSDVLSHGRNRHDQSHRAA
jgi:pyruvate dehydrogenase E2 component (dihydrolipoamide acetyltransferase)